MVGRSAQVPETVAFASHVLHESVRGHLNGEYQGRQNHAQFTDLQTGDILLCHNWNGGYGYWTHVVLYAGGGMAVDAYNFETGTTLSPVQNYLRYDEIRLLRPYRSQAGKIAARYALECVGKPYDPFSSLGDSRSEYCSKLIWQAYEKAGISLCARKAWIVPDDLSRSAELIEVSTWAS